MIFLDPIREGMGVFLVFPRYSHRTAATRDHEGPVQVPSPPAPRSNIGVRGSPERVYVIPGCGRGGDQDRTLVVMRRRRRRRRPPGGRGVGKGRTNQHSGTFNGPKQMLDAPLCRQFRPASDGSSEIIQIKAKMKVGWKSLKIPKSDFFFLFLFLSE